MTRRQFELWLWRAAPIVITLLIAYLAWFLQQLGRWPWEEE